jgi:hypothetical protein
MYQIDLLKGEGRPVKSEPWAVALVGAPSLIPLITAVVLIGSYIGNGIAISNAREQMTRIDARIAAMSETKQKRDTARGQIESGASCVGEIAAAMKMHMQWSDIISDVSRSVPANVVIYKLAATRDTRGQATGKTNPVKFTLLIGAYDTGEAGGKSIQKFIDTLKTSKVLGPKIDSIRPVSNQNGTFAGRDVAVLDIQCDLKPNQ